LDWDAIVRYIPLYKDAAVLTVKLGVLGIVFSVIVGLVCAVIQYQKIPVLSQIISIYIEISRNTPLLVQLFFFYYALPKVGFKIDPQTCGVFGLTFLGGSYMSESFRSGFEAIEKVQIESSLSLGMKPLQIIRYIIVPQAVCISFPSLLANVIFLLKETSVFSTVSLMDLMFTAKDLIGTESKTIECLSLLVVFYALILVPVCILGSLLERRLRRAGYGS